MLVVARLANFCPANKHMDGKMCLIGKLASFNASLHDQRNKHSRTAPGKTDYWLSCYLCRALATEDAAAN